MKKNNILNWIFQACCSTTRFMMLFIFTEHFILMEGKKNIDQTVLREELKLVLTDRSECQIQTLSLRSTEDMDFSYGSSSSFGQKQHLPQDLWLVSIYSLFSPRITNLQNSQGSPSISFQLKNNLKPYPTMAPWGHLSTPTCVYVFHFELKFDFYYSLKLCVQIRLHIYMPMLFYYQT